MNGIAALGHDLYRSLARAPLPSLSLYLALTLIAGSLAAVQAVADRWHQLRTLGLEVPLATLGQTAPDGSFKPVALRELRAFADARPDLDVLGYLQTTTRVVALAGAEQPAETAMVSPDFHRVLGLERVAGADLEADPRGIVLSRSGAEKLFGRQRDVVGQSLVVGQHQLTVIGLVDADLLGIAPRPVDAYLSLERGDVLISSALPMPLDADSHRKVRDALPIVHGFAVGRVQHGAPLMAAEWQPPATASIEISFDSPAPIPTLTLGFERRGFEPAVLPNLDLDPARSRRQQSIVDGLRLAAFGAGLVLSLMLAQYLAYFAEISRFELRLRHALGAGPTRLCFEHVAVFALPLLISLPLALLIATLLMDLLKASAGFAIQPETGLSPEAIALAVGFELGALGLAAALSARVVWRTSVNLNLRARGRLAPAFDGLQNTVIAALLCAGCALTSSGALALKVQFDLDPGADDRWLIRGGGTAVMQRAAAALAEAGVSHARVEHLPLAALPLAVEYRLDGVAGRTVIAGTNRMQATAPSLLGFEVVAGTIPERLAENEWIVNQAVAEALGVDPQAVVGRQLREANDATGGRGGRVVAVARLLRHQRLYDGGEPVVIGPASVEALAASGFGLVSDLQDAAQLKRIIDSVDASDQALRRSLATARTVADELAEQTRFERSAAGLYVGAGLLFTIVALIGLGSRLSLRAVQQRYDLAVHRALGARSADLAWMSVGPVIAAGVIGALIAVAFGSRISAAAPGVSAQAQMLAAMLGYAVLYALALSALASQAVRTGHAELNAGDR